MPPGKEGKIELAVEHTDGYNGEVAKSAAVTTNDPAHPNFNLILRARFLFTPPAGAGSQPGVAAVNRPAIGVEPNARWVTSALSGSSSTGVLYVINYQASPAHVKNVIAGGTNFTARLQPIQDGRRYELFVATNPALKPGHYTQTVMLETDSAAMPQVPVQLEVTVLPRVFASPAAIILPPAPASSDLSNMGLPTIYVRKIREGGLKIKGFTSSLPFVKLSLNSDIEGEVYTIRLTLDKSKIKPGEYKGTIRIETNDPDVPVVEIPVQGSFT